MNLENWEKTIAFIFRILNSDVFLANSVSFADSLNFRAELHNIFVTIAGKVQNSGLGTPPDLRRSTSASVRQ